MPTTGAASTFEYDLKGNLRYERQPNGTVIREYRWDQQNRLVKELHGTHESAYEYDGASRRVKITEKENGTQTKQETFVWCGSQICQKRSGSTVVRSYFGQGFQESGPTNYFYTRDHLGSVREVVGSDGTTVASRLSYDPWGKVTETGSGALSDFTYTGHYFDTATGLNLAQYRGYDPALGRWLSEDPLGLDGGLNLYGYVDNDPVNAMDPFGLSSAPSREELTFIAELLGVGNTAALINEHDAMLSAAARGDADGVECHGRKAAEATIKGIGELGMAAIASGGPPKQVYAGVRNVPQYPKNFVTTRGATRAVTTRNPVKNGAALDMLRQIEPGDWLKVYKDGWIGAEKATLHYFQSDLGTVFDFAIHLGRWSNEGSMPRKRKDPTAKFIAQGNEDIQRLIALLALGMCRAMAFGAVNADYACHRLLGPALISRARKAGGSARFIETLTLASELDAVQRLVPHAFETSLADVDKRLLDILRAIGPEDPIGQKWLAVPPRKVKKETGP